MKPLALLACLVLPACAQQAASTRGPSLPSRLGRSPTVYVRPPAVPPTLPAPAATP